MRLQIVSRQLQAVASVCGRLSAAACSCERLACSCERLTASCRRFTGSCRRLQAFVDASPLRVPSLPVNRLSFTTTHTSVVQEDFCSRVPPDPFYFTQSRFTLAPPRSPTHSLPLTSARLPPPLLPPHTPSRPFPQGPPPAASPYADNDASAAAESNGGHTATVAPVCRMTLLHTSHDPPPYVT